MGSWNGCRADDTGLSDSTVKVGTAFTRDTLNTIDTRGASYAIDAIGTRLAAEISGRVHFITMY